MNNLIDRRGFARIGIAMALLGSLLTACGGGGASGTGSGGSGDGSDFNLVYESADASGSISYTAVNSNALPDTRVLASGTSIGDLGVGSQTLFQGDVSNGVISNIRATRLVYLDGHHLMLGGLGADIGMKPTQISSEDISQICANDIATLDFKADKAILVYVTPGDDGECLTSDDVYKAVFLDDSATTAPHVFDQQTAIIGRFYDTQGALTSLLALSGSDLVRIAPDLTQSTIKTGVSDPECIQVGHSSTIIALDDASGSTVSFYSVGADGSLSAALYQTSTDETLQACAGDATDFYFSTSVAGSTLGPVTLSQGTTSLFHLPLDASASATKLYSLSDSSAITDVGLSGSKLVFVDLVAGSSSASNVSKLMAVDRATGSGPVLLDSVTGSDLLLDEVFNERIFYIVFGADAAQEKAIGTSGDSPADFGTGSSITFQPASTDFFYPQYDAPPYAFLVTNADSKGDGGSLSSIDLTTDAQTALWTIPSDASTAAGGVGSRGLFEVIRHDTSTTMGTQGDVYAYDLAKGTFLQITNTPDVDEAPLY